jgi:hypothetical protein
VTVYTRRASTRWWLALSPFWLLYGTLVLLWYVAVFSWRALVWAAVLGWSFPERLARSGTRGSA